MHKKITKDTPEWAMHGEFFKLCERFAVPEASDE